MKRGRGEELGKDSETSSMTTDRKPYSPTFSEVSVIGNTAKEIVGTLLSSSGYRVYPFGYESYFTVIKDLFSKGKFDNTTNPETVEKIRSMPDLVVMAKNLSNIFIK